MNAIYINPEDIGTTEWSSDWIKFCKKFGYDENNIPYSILVAEIKIIKE